MVDLPLSTYFAKRSKELNSAPSTPASARTVLPDQTQGLATAISADFAMASQVAAALEAGAECHEAVPWASMTLIMVNGQVIWRCKHKPRHEWSAGGAS